MPWYAALIEKVWSRDGLWAVIAVGLMGAMAYLYLGVIDKRLDVVEQRLEKVIFNQTRDCIRRLGPKADPVASCMTEVPR